MNKIDYLKIAWNALKRSPLSNIKSRANAKSYLARNPSDKLPDEVLKNGDVIQDITRNQFRRMGNLETAVGIGQVAAPSAAGVAGVNAMAAQNRSEEQLKQSLEQHKETPSNFGDEIKSQVENAWDSAKEAASDTYDQLTHLTDELHPDRLAIAMGVPLLLGAAVHIARKHQKAAENNKVGY